jgi:hypothetical protein
MNIKIDKYFSTSDLGLAATISLWYPLELVDRTQDPRKAFFIFQKTSQIEQLVREYWRGELKVNPQAHFNAIKAVKARLYE